MTGAEIITEERQRQQTVEGWTAEHDDEHTARQLVWAAVAYAKFAPNELNRPPADWPWEDAWWKPSDDPIRNLARAGALIAAEIDRLKRANSMVYCHACSKAGGADMPIYHDAPACPDTEVGK